MFLTSTPIIPVQPVSAHPAHPKYRASLENAPILQSLELAEHFRQKRIKRNGYVCTFSLPELNCIEMCNILKLCASPNTLKPSSDRNFVPNIFGCGCGGHCVQFARPELDNRIVRRSFVELILLCTRPHTHTRTHTQTAYAVSIEIWFHHNGMFCVSVCPEIIAPPGDFINWPRLHYGRCCARLPI